ncbi:hypothetical protein PGT21_022033 [Puccinia graminis f. sp. tritici]|uniref:Secreted protein n=1 Tax=Puccinia graminis f. sp. tritici TaxID=56615 RepID=A0A5B0QJ93_PUCGR|nr:hypothetical protein PGT21_022033 [Puccinia graminis f. sp. tritici]
MYSVSFITLAVLALLGQLILANPDSTPRQTMKCTNYNGANTTSATCDDLPDVKCIGGCRGTPAVAEGCQVSDGSDPDHKIPLSKQKCDVGFGRDTLASKSCRTKEKTYSCSGKITPAKMSCYGCNKSKYL